MVFSPTQQQQQIIDHNEGPLLVIAGPGSGKTFTLVERIVSLVLERGVSPEEIFVATFTEKAANELVARIARRLLNKGVVANIDDMYIGTFHSICLRFLEEYREYTRLKKNFTVMDQFDQEYFLFQKMRTFEEVASLSLLTGKEESSRWKRATTLCSWINKLSEELVDPERLCADQDELIQALGMWYKVYLKLLDEENLLDFSVIQVEALRLIENNPENVQEKMRKKLRYLMVDEYQDTNTVQERLLLALLNEKQNICVVGDDDQGLYRFRGATIRNILEFKKSFGAAECKMYSLTTNYRSDPGIIDFYNRWMDGSCDSFSWKGEEGKEFRYAKNIIPPEGKGRFSAPVICVSGDAERHDWHEEVLAFLRHMYETKLEDWNQVAFLFRSVKNENVQRLAEFLEQNNIPVYAPRSDLFFKREEVQMVIGFLLYLFPIFRDIRAEWGQKHINLEVWQYYDQCLRSVAEQLRRPENKELRDWGLHRVHEIQTMMVSNRPLDFGFSALFYQILQFPLFSKYLEVRASKKDERAARNLAKLSQMLTKFEYLHHIQVLHPAYLKKNINDLFNHFFRYLKEGGITEFEDADDTTPSGAVAFMTIHQAKGLEFPVTIVGSMKAIPRKQYTELDSILQERFFGRKPYEPMDRIKDFDFKRLFYTAFSRAKNLLVLTAQEETTGRGRHGCPSKYFKPFYAPLPQWKDVDFSSLVVDKVQPASAKGRYSYTSHILVYEGCPRQYQFYKYWDFMPVREGPMLFGQLVHQTIEDIHKTVLRGKPEDVTEANAKLWFDVNYANLSHKERVYLAPQIRDVAFDHVLRYMERKNGHWEDIRETEVDVSLVKDDYILTGKIDLVQGEGDTVEIVDFKSTPKPNQYAEKHILERYKRQLEIYAHLVEQRYGLKVSVMNLYYTGETSGVPIYRFPYKSESVDATIAEVDKLVGCIEGKCFDVASRPDKLCKECDLKSYCDREGC